MEVPGNSFDEHSVLHHLRYFLPAQAPLKDFTHHNSLHAFQEFKFFDGIQKAREILGYKVSLSVAEYRSLYNEKRINPHILEKTLLDRKGAMNASEWREKILFKKFNTSFSPRVGSLKANWRKQYQIDLDSLVHLLLFRVLCSYLDQGVAIWKFPVDDKGFLSALREMEANSFSSFFRTKRARNLLLSSTCDMAELLKIVVGDESFYTQYLFDQQFAHPGWSGIVSAIEDKPDVLPDGRKISLHDLIVFELLLEIDALENRLGESWKPLTTKLAERPTELFAEVPKKELNEVVAIWQEAYEWSYYDQILTAIKNQKHPIPKATQKSFQALFSIDDLECSIRWYLEEFDSTCETFSTSGFFGLEFYYQSEGSKLYNKLGSVSTNPKYLVKEITTGKSAADINFDKHAQSLVNDQSISWMHRLWSSLKLTLNIFKSTNSHSASSSENLHHFSKLTIENKNLDETENDLQIGFTFEEMADRVEGLLKSIGLTKNFAPIVYVIGHGSSIINNPHYTAHHYGVPSEKVGCVNARVLSFMANHHSVRAILDSRGISIPLTTQFLGGMHDAMRDEIIYYDEEQLSSANLEGHRINDAVFKKALDYNAKERSSRFKSINASLNLENAYKQIRAFSQFGQETELNYANNALCLIGKRDLTKNFVSDRRAFTNSYDYKIDPDGKYLFEILKAAVPICGGINLEYYFSRVDDQKLGSGTKLSHNVMGLFGVANGMDGDLRPGLSNQMTETHEPLRMLFIIEQFPEVVLDTIKKLNTTYEWFMNEWSNLAVVNPETQAISVFKEGEFVPYKSYTQTIKEAIDLTLISESDQKNLPLYSIH